jgi:phospholipid-binding lipoprotein MlaA
MKNIQLAVLLTAALMMALLAGCAAQSPNAGAAPGPQLTLRPDKPMLLSGATPESIDAEETDLLKEDWEEEEGLDMTTVADPLEWFNRAMFQFNDKFYFYLIKPVALGYRAVTPEKIRTGAGNFFTNLLFPIRLVNCILQGKGQAAEAELAKFLYNSTVGVLGFGNPSQKYAKLNPDPEDLGQTLGSYGIGDGFYIVWPFVGPSTLRDTIGQMGNTTLNPVSYVDPLEMSLAIKGYDYFNRFSFRIEDLEALKEAAFDPYQSARDLYIQSRRNHIKK